MPDLVTPPPVERFRRWGIVAWSLIGILIIAALAFWSLTRVREIFPPLVLALVVIYMLNPIVTRLERAGVRRVFGSCATYLLLVMVTIVAFTLLVPTLITQGRTFAKEFPHISEKVTKLSTDVSKELDRRFHIKVDPERAIGDEKFPGRVGRFLGGFLRGALETVTLLVIGVVLSFYLLIDLPRLQRALLRLIPPERRDEWRTVGGQVGQAMGGFFRGQLVVALIVGVMSALGLRIIGLPYWLVIGLIAGFFNLVPLIGPFIGAIPAVLVAGTFKPPIYMLWAALVLLVVQQIDNHLISPNVMRWTVRLHPVTVMLSLTAGAALAGFFGMLLVVPFVASMKMIIGHFWRTRVPWGEEVFEEGDRMEGIAAEQIAPDGTHPDATRPAVLPSESGSSRGAEGPAL
jgi:predicted PurR-regulated permease PerM